MLNSKTAKRTLGVIGGLGSLAGGDLFFKLIKSQPIQANIERYHLLFEQHPFRDSMAPLTEGASMTSRKLYIYQVCKEFSDRGADAVLVPCFASHTFREELQAELDIPLIDLMAALKAHVFQLAAPGAKLGVLTSGYVRSAKLFERYFGDHYPLIYPTDETQAALMSAVYGPGGIKAGVLEGISIEQVHQTCLELEQHGATLLLPGMTELSLVAHDLRRRGVSFPDVNQIYASFATTCEAEAPKTPFKLGIVGGVGPAATVDFMSKVIKNTPAKQDQGHIKMVVEHNPQIPDRTANLLHKQTDPTVALYATCKRLECEGANAIAIPCNTAHAYVSRIQPLLRIPIVNMLTETVEFVRRTHGTQQPVGLLATSGTIESGVYHDAAKLVGISLLVPDASQQRVVMSAIYGTHGIKAGHVSGQCRDEILQAAAHLVEKGASVLILGCTELPLVLPHSDDCLIAGRHVSLIDPTDILAKRCVELSANENLP